MKQSNEQKISDVLKAFVKSPKLDKGYTRSVVLDTWHSLMGPSISSKTQSIYYSKGKLFISLSSASLRHELSLGKDKIITIMNAALGSDKIKEIVLK